MQQARRQVALVVSPLITPSPFPLIPHSSDSVVDGGGIGAGGGTRGARGCFCNPECAEWALAVPAEATAHCLDALGDAFTVPKFASCLGDRAVGPIRISLGLESV